MDAHKESRRKTLLADKIEPFEFPFDAQAWQSFELARDVRNQQKQTRRRLIAVGLGVFITLLGICFGLFQRTVNQSKAVLIGENISSPKNTPSVFDAHSDNKTALSNTPSISNNNSPLISNNNKSSISNNKTQISDNNTPLISDNNTSLVSDNKMQSITDNNNPLISNNSNLLINDNNNPLINADNKQAIDSVNKNAGKIPDLKGLMLIDLVLNHAEISKDSINKNDFNPLSIKVVWDTVSSSENASLPIIPPIISKNKRELNNSLSIGFGQSSLASYNETQRLTTFSVIYLRRFTPLMSVGVNTTYSQGKANGRFLSGDIQLDFTLIKRRKFEFNLTTGYGFRNWQYLDGVNYSGNTKGITIGIEMAYFPRKNYFVACRLDNKETKVYNTSVLFQIGKLF